MYLLNITYYYGLNNELFQLKTLIETSTIFSRMLDFFLAGCCKQINQKSGVWLLCANEALAVTCQPGPWCSVRNLAGRD